MDKHVEVLRRMENDIYSKHFRRRREALTAAIAALEAERKAERGTVREVSPCGGALVVIRIGEGSALRVDDHVRIIPADAVGGG